MGLHHCKTCICEIRIRPTMLVFCRELDHVKLFAGGTPQPLVWLCSGSVQQCEGEFMSTLVTALAYCQWAHCHTQYRPTGPECHRRAVLWVPCTSRIREGLCAPITHTFLSCKALSLWPLTCFVKGPHSFTFRNAHLKLSVILKGGALSSPKILVLGPKI